jgi:hypothetical protein
MALVLYRKVGTRILPMSVAVDLTREAETGWIGVVNGEARFFPREKWTREEPPASEGTGEVIAYSTEEERRALAEASALCARANPTERPALLEIVSALTVATERADLPGMTRAATLLASHAGALMAALVVCVPVVRDALADLPPEPSANRARAYTAARAILDLTGIDPAKEGP